MCIPTVEQHVQQHVRTGTILALAVLLYVWVSVPVLALCCIRFDMAKVVITCCMMVIY